ncbi:MAG TPA: DUF3540 domain-containing protein [Polyangiaceae bacterium]|nr:DUF3540 domain-containing protein [Polyangiaceae bacterium]
MSKIARREHEGDEGGASAAFDASSAMESALGAIAAPGARTATSPSDRRSAMSLGPREVVAVDSPFVVVSAADGTLVQARLARAVPYEPAIGDVLLVIEGGDGAWVIGVVSGSGSTRLQLDGDVEVAASGVLRLSGGAGVELTGPDVEVRADRLSMIAGRVTQAYHSVRKTVRELLSVHAGEQHTLVDGTSHAQAKSTRILSEQKVTINGREIFLG